MKLERTMRLIVCLLLAACSHSAPAPQVTARPSRAKDPCREAEKLRRSGFTKLLDLDLKGARADFNAALALDPTNTGALQQLQVIDAMETGTGQVGASEANSHLSSRSSKPRCREGQAVAEEKPASESPARGIVDIDGQVGLSSSGQDSDKVTTAIVHDAIRRMQSEITICYQRALTRNVTLHGALVLKFTISEEGRVQSLQAEESTLGDSDMESCVAKTVAGLVFAKTKGSVHFVSYPLSFH
jgi:hypothetical protein